MQNGYKFWHLRCISFCFVLHIPEIQHCQFSTGPDGQGKDVICFFHAVIRVPAIIFFINLKII